MRMMRIVRGVQKGTRKKEGRRQLRKRKNLKKVKLYFYNYVAISILITKIVHIDDGEASEATILQIRAKLFAMGSKEVGWKERGVGTLKINVPKVCVELDDTEHAIPGTFDPSMMEGQSVRLVMRQENTHRVILNTVVMKGMEFNPKPSSTSAQVLFTAFEGEGGGQAKPVNMILKVSYFFFVL